MSRETEQLFAALAILGAVLLAAHLLDGMLAGDGGAGALLDSQELVTQFVMQGDAS